MNKLAFFLSLVLGIIATNSWATSYTAPYASATTGSVIYAAQWNANQTSLESFLNNQNLDGTTNIAVGGIQTANIANSAVTDAKIAGITTAGKVNGSAITGINNLPSGAGVIPTANLGSSTASSITFLRGDQTWNNPFAYYVKISNTQTSGTGGGSATSGSWQVYPMNTKDLDPQSIGTLSGNALSLPAGTYIVYGSIPFNQIQNVQSRLYNATASAILLNGTSGIAVKAGQTYFISEIIGEFTLSTTSSVEVEYQSSQTNNGDDLGWPCSFGTEVYGQVQFQKVA
jgi:hypothetical protein